MSELKRLDPKIVGRALAILAAAPAHDQRAFLDAVDLAKMERGKKASQSPPASDRKAGKDGEADCLRPNQDEGSPA
jgi:hypothetical protein